jgi:cell division initiation protein
MGYTPVELRHVKVGRSFFGYNRGRVEQLLDEVADSFEVVWHDRGELTDRVEELQRELVDLRAREQLLSQTLVAAEQAGVEMREQARREAEVIVAEAHHEARSVARSAQADRDRLIAEALRVEGFLRAALGMVGEASVASPEETAATPFVPEPEVEAPAVPEAEALPHAEPEAVWPVEEPAEPQGPYLRQVVGGESRDFEWGDQ